MTERVSELCPSYRIAQRSLSRRAISPSRAYIATKYRKMPCYYPRAISLRGLSLMRLRVKLYLWRQAPCTAASTSSAHTPFRRSSSRRALTSV